MKQRVNQYNQMAHPNANVSLDEAQSKSTTADNTPTNLSSATSPSRGDAKDVNEHASVSVLNDIGNMLANLTDELDAMLEEEKRVGLNDSE